MSKNPKIKKKKKKKVEGEKTIRPGEKLSSYPARIVAFIQILHRVYSHRYPSI